MSMGAGLWRGRYRFALLLLGPLCLGPLLGGCETAAMRDVPVAPDRPWVPPVDRQGHMLAGGDTGDTISRARRPGLRLPEGFRLAADHTMPWPGSSPAKGAGEGMAVQADRAYGLAELIDLAQSINPATRMAWDAAREGAAETGVARSRYLPQLTATAMGGYGTLNPHARLRGLVSGTSNPRIDGTLEHQQVGFQWLLFDFGKRRAVMEEVSRNSLARNIMFTGAHQKVIHQVAMAYYHYAAALRHVALVRQSLDNAHAIARAAQANLHNGQGTVIDTSQAEQAVAGAVLAMAQAEGEVQTRRLGLLTAIGLDPSRSLHVQTDDGREIHVEDIRLSEAMVHEAVSRRPDVLAAYTSLRAAGSAVQGARASFRPQIFISGNADYSFGNFRLRHLPIGGGVSQDASTRSFGGLVSAGISVPIYDGGMRRNRLRQAHEREDSARAALQDAQNGAVRAIIEAETMLHTGITAYQAARSLQKASQTGFDAALAAYRSGDGTMTRMLELQNTLLNARLAVTDSYYAMLGAAATLAYAAGTLGSGAALADVGGTLVGDPPAGPVP